MALKHEHVNSRINIHFDRRREVFPSVPSRGFPADCAHPLHLSLQSPKPFLQVAVSPLVFERRPVRNNSCSRHCLAWNLIGCATGRQPIHLGTAFDQIHSVFGGFFSGHFLAPCQFRAVVVGFSPRGNAPMNQDLGRLRSTRRHRLERLGNIGRYLDCRREELS